MNKSPRRYPPVYERLLPIALGLVALLVLVLLVVTLAIALRWIAWA